MNTLVLMSTMLGNAQDVAEELACSDSAVANLAVMPAGRRVSDHTHLSAFLQLTVLGRYQEDGDGGRAKVEGPAAVFFPPGSAHEMAVGPQGLAAVVIEFDFQRLRRLIGDSRLDRLQHWIGGDIGARASRLARSWLSDARPAQQFAETALFLRQALAAPPACPSPAWMSRLEEEIETASEDLSTDRVAARLGVSQPWLLRAYRHWRGEGLVETIRRRRVGAAALLLESPGAGLAEIAAAAGFCDQSHMNRAFRLVVGRTPARVRAARLGLSPQL